MSRPTLKRILESMGIKISQEAENELLGELLNVFFIIGSANEECSALDDYWEMRREDIQKFIRMWLKRKRKKKKRQEIILEVQ